MLIITATIVALKWHHMKLSMEESVDPLCVGMRFRERELTGPEIIQGAAEKIALIKRRLETTTSRQKSYADSKRRNIEFWFGDLCF